MERIETAGSVRVYFLFFGLLYILIYHDPTQGEQGTFWLSLLGLLQGIFYVSVGLACHALLNRAAWLIRAVLVEHMSYSVLYAFSHLFMNEAQNPPAQLIFRLACAVGLILYVLRNVERLAAAKQNGAGGAGSVAPADTGF